MKVRNALNNRVISLESFANVLKNCRLGGNEKWDNIVTTYYLQNLIFQKMTTGEKSSHIAAEIEKTFGFGYPDHLWTMVDGLPVPINTKDDLVTALNLSQHEMDYEYKFLWWEELNQVIEFVKESSEAKELYAISTDDSGNLTTWDGCLDELMEDFGVVMTPHLLKPFEIAGEAPGLFGVSAGDKLGEMELSFKDKTKMADIIAAKSGIAVYAHLDLR